MAKYDEINKSDLKDVLRQLRVNRGLTQTQVADYLNVNRTTYTKYESGREPDLDSLRALAKLYDISLDELISGRYSERTGKIVFAKSAKKETEEDEFYPLSDDEKKLISYFRSCSRPTKILRFAKNLYHDDLLDLTEDEEKNN